MKRGIALFTLIFLIGVIFILYRYLLVTPNNGYLTLYGNVDVRQVDIAFRIPGQVTQLFFEEGNEVSKGSLMAILNPTPYDSQVAQATANLKNIQANFSHAAILLQRRRSLVADGSISQEDLDNALSSYDQLAAQFTAAEASLQIAEDNLNYTRAYAPTDGVILTRIREPGSIVRESDPVYTLSIASPVWVRAFIDESYLGLVNDEIEAEIFTDNPHGHSYIGKVGFISPLAEFTPKSVETTKLRTDLVYRLRIYVDKPDGGLRQGMPVTVKLNLGKRE